MILFDEYITESKNLHLTHVEDNIILDGSKGAAESIRFLLALTEMFHGGGRPKSVSVTIKFDGAPAVFAGVDPTNGKFFVGTKSIFNATPKINYTNDDIDRNHGHAPGLASKLKIALQYFPSLGIKGVIQGDMMYTKGDLSTKKIDGETHVTFKPNTILYAVPLDSKLGKTISSAQIGVVWHTEYKGSGRIADLKASFGFNVKKLKTNKNVWSIDASFSDETGLSSLSTIEYNNLSKNLRLADQLVRKSGRQIDSILSNRMISADLMIYINALIRDGKFVPSSASFLSYLTSKNEMNLKKLKTDRGREKRKNDFEMIRMFVQKNTKTLESLFRIHSILNESKIILLGKLNKAKTIGSFLVTPNGLKVTDPEGYVAVSHIGSDGRAFKLVDRLEFSRANFNAAKDWIGRK